MNTTAPIEVIVGDADTDMRLDVFVGAQPGVVSRSAAERMIEGGYVTVDGAIRPKRHTVSAGECVIITPPPPLTHHIEPEAIPLDIRYEDDDLIVLSKQAGLVVHPAHGNWSGTLVNALAYHSRELGGLQGEDRPGIVHRLDKDTSGLMLVAKTDAAQAHLQDQIRLREIDRRYLCLVHGNIAPETATIDAPIARDRDDRMLMTVSDRPGARGAITTLTVMERLEAGRYDNGFTLVECKLYTGRTHQIRVHMRYIDHPVVGDPVYGRGNDRANHGLHRQFLHSYRLTFVHPTSGEEMEFVDTLPDDLQLILDNIKDGTT
ncbi:MAG: RluA family pseudouridine synthase [Coriobacteriia bacterium]|nr:RluA family pseudouridine synthase [Coriobacteriia bacterium]